MNLAEYETNVKKKLYEIKFHITRNIRETINIELDMPDTEYNSLNRIPHKGT